MINSINGIEFLNKLSGVFTEKIPSEKAIDIVNELFQNYLKLDKTEFIIWDNSNMLLRNFSDKQEGSIDISNGINFVYDALVSSNGSKFYFNDSEFDCSVREEEQYHISALKSDENNIIFPLVSNGQVFGLINMQSSKNAFTKEFFTILNIASKLISGGIANYILNEQMEMSLNFYRAMKDIAKIIESQYELSYIIPLIGEMIDRFMSRHLIYIFIYTEDKYTLVWPKACKDENIFNLLKRADASSGYLISENKKSGVFPLINEDKILGAIAVSGCFDKLMPKEIDYLEQLARQAGLTIQRANMYADVLKYASLDALTGLNNRRQFEIRIKQEVSNSRRNNLPLCCIMLDADYFKKVNDTYGHSAGDCVLKKTAEIIMREKREYDFACRFGGEEFFIILPQTKPEEALKAAERLRRAVEEEQIDIKEARAGADYISITASFGICAFEENDDAETLIQKADKALYKAKNAGRNRTELYKNGVSEDKE